MASSRTKPSTPRLSELARKLVYPSDIASTGWPAVEAKAAELGIAHYDPWQQGLGRLILGKRADGRYAATVGGIVLSIPRQVGKTFLVGSIVMVLCILFPGLQVVWTAHRSRTTTRTFQSLRRLSKRKKVWPYILHIRSANGEQEIAFRNGSVIMFGAREQGFGRGFDEIDIEVFDEAQILTVKALEDMIAATNQARHPHGALLFYMGTPPRPNDPGEAFADKRRKAYSNRSKDMVYVEASADPEGGLDDAKQWAKANWSYPLRTPVESMLRLRENLPDDDAWRREGLGIWDADDMGDPILRAIQAKWGSLREPSAVVPTACAYAIDVSPDRLHSTIGAAGVADGRRLAFVDTADVGVGWIVPRLVELQHSKGLERVTVDNASPAAALIPKLEEAGIEVVKSTAGDMGRACGLLFDAIQLGELAHLDDPILNAALAAATTRPIGEATRPVGDGSWAWRRKGSANITPLVAVTLALAASHETEPAFFGAWR